MFIQYSVEKDTDDRGSRPEMRRGQAFHRMKPKELISIYFQNLKNTFVFKSISSFIFAVVRKVISHHGGSFIVTVLCTEEVKVRNDFNYVYFNQISMFAWKQPPEWSSELYPNNIYMIWTVIDLAQTYLIMPRYWVAERKEFGIHNSTTKFFKLHILLITIIIYQYKKKKY